VIRIELKGLEVFGYHGCEDWERRDGQPFLYDVELEVGDAALSDRLGDTVDYTLVAALVQRVSDERSSYLLEALAGRIADALLAEFPTVAAVRVRARKPQVQIPGFQVEFSAAAVERRR
jgi:dihydroneopterin aldolase